MRRFMYLKNVVTLALEEERCVGCGVCTVVCPHEVLSLANGKVHVEIRDACMECGACAMNCPTGAVTVSAGVGCATAVINSLLGRKSSSCCCTVDSAGTEAERLDVSRRDTGGGCC